MLYFERNMNTLRSSAIRKATLTALITEMSTKRMSSHVPEEAARFPHFVLEHYDVVTQKLRLDGKSPAVVMRLLTQQWMLLPRDARVVFGNKETLKKTT